MRLSRRQILAGSAGLAALAMAPQARADAFDLSDWDSVAAAARGQQVYFNAWGGDRRINDYIAWAGQTLMERHGVELIQVKISDVADAVTRVLAERTAGQDSDGAIDLIWINGENFAAMKANDLLFGPFTSALPNWRLVDLVDNPTALVDFTIPTDGLEAPWGRAQFNILYDSDQVSAPPPRFAGFLDWAKEHPRRLTYPRPPDFMGTTFLKQGLITLTPDPSILEKPPADQAAFDAAAAPLWDFLDQLTPLLWRGGSSYPTSGPAQQQMLADGELDFAFSFNPGDLQSGIATGLFPASTESYLFDGGTLGNSHFLAIPYNARAKAGALVAINFLISSEAQARKADPQLWGDPTILALAALTPAERARFESLASPPQPLTPGASAPSLPEPHPAWTSALEAAWTSRYGR
ncbi:MAG: ABC transporter substrate-binding protein [Pseudomonadota bacterium]